MRDNLELDMISVPVGLPLRSVVVGAPSYLDACAAPDMPRDLARHRCIGFRNADGILSPWSFEKDGRTETVKVTSSIIVNDGDALVAAACAGMGLAYMLEDLAVPFLQDGQLVEVLENWSPPFPGYHVYYSNRRHPPPAVTLFLDLLRQEL
jgi:DNA-binding transcriptional LysR family regulator